MLMLQYFFEGTVQLHAQNSIKATCTTSRPGVFEQLPNALMPKHLQCTIKLVVENDFSLNVNERRGFYRGLTSHLKKSFFRFFPKKILSRFPLTYLFLFRNQPPVWYSRGLANTSFFRELHLPPIVSPVSFKKIPNTSSFSCKHILPMEYPKKRRLSIFGTLGYQLLDFSMKCYNRRRVKGKRSLL